MEEGCLESEKDYSGRMDGKYRSDGEKFGCAGSSEFYQL